MIGSTKRYIRFLLHEEEKKMLLQLANRIKKKEGKGRERKGEKRKMKVICTLT